MPVLWLVAVLHCPLEFVGLFKPDYCCFSAGSTKTSPADSSNGGCSLANKSSAIGRCAFARQDDWLPQNLMSTVMEGARYFPQLPPVILLTGDVLALGHRWQFVWRTAVSPRAPAFLA